MSQPVVFNRQPPPPTPSENVVTISTQLMVAAVIFLFMVVVFIFFLYLYAKHYLRSNPRSRTRFIFAGAAAEQTPVARRGLDAQLLKSLPIKIFSPSDFKDGLECAVCLSEISRGEEVRLLPKCSHGFHVACIDMWFHSHSTCPLCRSPVVAGEAEAVEVHQIEQQDVSFPTNVLFWGNQEVVRNGVLQSQAEASSSKRAKRPEGSLAIDIPRRVEEEFLSPMEETKTPGSARLRSLRRLLSRGKMVVIGAYSPRGGGGGDVEQGVMGEGSSLAPKTPTGR